MTKSFEDYGRGTQNSFKSGSSLCHLFQELYIFSGTGSPHSKFCSHKRWSNIFIKISVGARAPSQYVKQVSDVLALSVVQ